VAGSLSWSWGALSRLSFLPRVSTGRLVLSLAQWRLGRQEIERLRQGDGTKRYRSVQAVRRERGLPRFVSLVQAGSRLLVDLDNALSVDVLLHLIERRTEAVLVEHFPGADELVAHGPEGRFVHELIVPFVRRGAEGQAAPVTPKRSPGEVATVVRRCPPGSEWLYAKLYAGPAAVDRILLDMLPPFIERCRTAGWMERWFFVRYADPDWHLRLRFQGEPGTLFGSLLPALREAVAPPLADGRLWRLELDTYEREVERYGGPEGMALAEDFFQCDSDAVLAVLPLACRDEGVEDRWRITLLGLDMLLADFGFDTARKMTLIEDALVSLLEGANGLSRPLKHKLGERFRELRPSLDGLFDATRDKSPTREGALRMLRRRSRESTPIIQGLRSARTTGRLRSSVEAIALDYLHLFANRMLRSAQKSQELVLYDFLRRSYESAAARQPGGAS
jgi:thiopeptide-type bacteriocin biosynthesis protein